MISDTQLFVTHRHVAVSCAVLQLCHKLVWSWHRHKIWEPRKAGCLPGQLAHERSVLQMHLTTCPVNYPSSSFYATLPLHKLYINCWFPLFLTFPFIYKIQKRSATEHSRKHFLCLWCQVSFQSVAEPWDLLPLGFMLEINLCDISANFPWLLLSQTHTSIGRS